jgi:hypothetical protein
MRLPFVHELVQSKINSHHRRRKGGGDLLTLNFRKAGGLVLSSATDGATGLTKARPDKTGNAQPARGRSSGRRGHRHFEKETQAVSDVLKSGEQFDYVITVCDESSAEKCPVFPGLAKRLNWSFSDPSQVTGTKDEKLAQVRKIRDEIFAKLENWCAAVCS